MKIHHVEQNSLDWLQLRCGVVTASEFDALISPAWKARTGAGVETYLARKLAEKWTGHPLPGYQSIDMEFGKLREQEALPWYELEFGEEIERVGFITTDDGALGCSPDGLLGEYGGIEVKCPAAHTHVAYLLDGELPPEYAAQVHASLFVTGRKWWRFLSYRRGFPALVLTVERDEETMEKLAEATEAFLTRLNEGWRRLCDLNDGPPEHLRPAAPKPRPALVSDPNDIIP